MIRCDAHTGFTLAEVMIATTLVAVVFIGIGAFEVSRIRIAQDIQQRTSVTEPQHLQAALASLRIGQGLTVADRAVVNAAADTVQLRSFVPSADNPPGCPAGSCTTVGAVPSACCFDIAANYRWDEYHYNSAGSAIELYTGTRAGCTNKSLLAQQITSLNFSYVDASAAPPGGEPFPDARDNNLVQYQLQWTDGALSHQFTGQVAMRAVP